MKCWHCETELIWQSDCDYADMLFSDDGIISILDCPNCPSFVHAYFPLEGGVDESSVKN